MSKSSTTGDQVTHTPCEHIHGNSSTGNGAFRNGSSAHVNSAHVNIPMEMTMVLRTLVSTTAFTTCSATVAKDLLTLAVDTHDGTYINEAAGIGSHGETTNHRPCHQLRHGDNIPPINITNGIWICN